MGVKHKTEYNEYKIQKILSTNFLSENTKKYELFNLFIYNWESDYLTITKSDIAYECEIKISKQDFLNDSKKFNKHMLLENAHDIIIPNHFSYVAPEGIINPSDVPKYAGLITVSGNGIKVVKNAPLLHNDKFNYEKTHLMNKLYYNLNNYRTLYKESNVSELKSKIKFLEKELSFYDNRVSELVCENSDLKHELENKHNE